MDRPEVADLIRRVEAAGGTLEARGGRLVVSVPRGAMTAELQDALRQGKEDLLEHLRRSGEEGPGPVKGSAGSRAPLGPVQRRMWMMDRLDTDSSLLHLAGAWRLKGSLDVEAFTSAMAEIVRRHDILRIRLEMEEGEPVQVLEETLPDPVRFVDLSAGPDPGREERMMSLVLEARDAPFDLTAAPLFRALLIRMAEDEHVFAFVPHHVIWDGWCWDILHGELAALYPACLEGRASPLPELPFGYLDFAAWHRRRTEGPDLQRQLSFWKATLDMGIEPLRFPARPEGSGHGMATSGDAHRRVLELDRGTLERLSSLAREEGATLFMALLSAWAVWLSRATGQGRFGIGVPIQDRLHPGTEGVLGVMVNTVVIPVRIEGRRTFREILRGIRDVSLGAYENQDLPYEILVREMARVLPERGSLFQTLFSYQDVRNRPSRIGTLSVHQIHVDAGVGESDVGCGFMVTEDRGVALLDFRKELFDPATASRMSAGFRELVRDASAHPDREAGRLSVTASDSRIRAVTHLLGDEAAHEAGVDADPVAPTQHQQGIWFVDEVTGGTSANHLAERLHLRGPLDPGRVGDAWNRLAAMHDALRMCAPGHAGYPELVVADAVPGVEVLRADSVDAALEALDERFLAPFDLGGGPLWRLTLVSLTGETGWLLQLVCHALVADERSLAELVSELADLYGGGRGEPGRPGFLEHARREHETSDSPEAREGLDWWLHHLSEGLPPLTLPCDGPREAAVVRPAASLPVDFGPDRRATLARFADALGVSEASVLLAGWTLALARASGTEAFQVGVVVPTAEPADARQAPVGPLQNTVLVPVRLGSAGSFAEHCGQTHRRLQEALAHRTVPFERVVAEVNPARRLGTHPLYDAQVILSDHPEAVFAADGVESTRLSLPRRAIHEDLSLRLNRRGGAGWVGGVDFAASLFDGRTVGGWSEQFLFLLDEGMARPDEPLAALAGVPEEQLQRVLRLGRGRESSFPPTILGVLEETAASHGDRVAVAGAGARVTYGELWKRSGRLAEALITRGVPRESTIGLCMARTPDLVVALLGILRAGAAYLPLDPEFPEDRLRFMVADAGSPYVLTDGRVDVPSGDAEILLLDEVEALADGGSGGTILPSQAADALAYLIYTSGSTGRPKGVGVTHGNLANFIQSMAREPGLLPSDVLLSVTTLSFDIAGLELWLPLAVGARVEMADEEEVRDGEWLADRLDASGATVMQATPSTWRMLLDASWDGHLRMVLCGGETFPRDLPGPLLERADEVWNLYGPTETTVWSTIHRVHEAGDAAVPIGLPIDNTRVVVMDAHGRFAPPGVPGELWIAGAGVARGYHGLEELTRERFVADPVSGRGVAYRTGDLVRWRPDGLLEHLGRLDHQVKVHGHRIELGEVESVLMAHPAIRQAVAAVHGERADTRLVAYVVTVPGKDLLASEVRRYLRTQLPDYMTPGAVLELDAIPLTPNGKIDRAALPDPNRMTEVRSHREPATRLEEIVAAVWRELLGIESVGRDDNFFELGGHSLLAIRAVARLAEEGLRLDPRSFFFLSLEQVAASAVAEDTKATIQ